MVCADTERHLQEDYFQRYHCRFEATFTAPNPLVGYAIRATLSDGREAELVRRCKFRHPPT